MSKKGTNANKSLPAANALLRTSANAHCSANGMSLLLLPLPSVSQLLLLLLSAYTAVCGCDSSVCIINGYKLFEQSCRVDKDAHNGSQYTVNVAARVMNDRC
jgi:hypothetical protein